MEILKQLSLVPRGLRYKLMIAFCLMSIIPLLIFAYIITNYFNFVYPFERQDVGGVIFIILIAVGITIIGLKLARELVDPIIKMAVEAKIIASGDVDRVIEVKREDEIGELASALNQITRRIKDNMDELRTYGERTKEINIEIHKKVIALSGLLQVGNLISSATELDEVLDFIIEKISQMGEVTSAFLMLREGGKTDELAMRVYRNLPSEELAKRKVKIGSGFLGDIAAKGKVFIVELNTKTTKDIEKFQKEFGVPNVLILPIISGGRSVGLLGVGNKLPNFKYEDGDVRLIEVFTRQIAIAVENDMLARKAEELSIKDDLTGLYNESYIRNRLDEEIKRAVLYQRPCSFILLEIDDFDRYRSQQGELAAEGSLKKMALVLEESTTDVDKVARFSGNQFAICLPEKSKKEASNIAEDIRKKIGEMIFPGDDSKGSRKLTVSGGLSENPIDGITADELIEKADKAVDIAQSQGKNKIIS